MKPASSTSSQKSRLDALLKAQPYAPPAHLEDAILLRIREAQTQERVQRFPLLHRARAWGGWGLAAALVLGAAVAVSWQAERGPERASLTGDPELDAYAYLILMEMDVESLVPDRQSAHLLWMEESGLY